MSKIEETSFRFESFFVKESHIVLNEQKGEGILVNIQPSGSVYKSLGVFKLELNVEIKEENNKFNIKLSTVSVFKFGADTNIDKYMSSFIVNAPAIVFPYIRSYIASLTAQSGIFTITLPTYNLSNLADELKSKIQIIE